MLVDKQSELMSDLLFTVHQHGGYDVTWKPPIKLAADKLKKKKNKTKQKQQQQQQTKSYNAGIDFFKPWRRCIEAVRKFKLKKS